MSASGPTMPNTPTPELAASKEKRLGKEAINYLVQIKLSVKGGDTSALRVQNRIDQEVAEIIRLSTPVNFDDVSTPEEYIIYIRVLAARNNIDAAHKYSEIDGAANKIVKTKTESKGFFTAWEEDRMDWAQEVIPGWSIPVFQLTNKFALGRSAKRRAEVAAALSILRQKKGQQFYMDIRGSLDSAINPLAKLAPSLSDWQKTKFV